MIVVLASLAPILVFFTLSTRSHSFMVLLNIVNFLIAAAWGRSFLVQTMHGLLLSEESNTCDTSTTPAPVATPEATPPTELQFDDSPAPLPTEAALASASPVIVTPTEPAGSLESPGAASAGGEEATATPQPNPQTAHQATPAPTSGPRRINTASPSPRTAAQREAPAASIWWLTPQDASPVAKVKGVLRTWLAIFVGVGLQMTWILGPLVGNPKGSFLWFHPPGSGNFVQAFLSVLFG
jgi:hypothetical protein